MEKRHKEINDLITKVALGNPDITQAQIARARAMYNGDTRTIEEIEAELLAYSEEISANARKAEMGRMKGKPEIVHPTIQPGVEHVAPEGEIDPELAELIADVKKLRNEKNGGTPTVQDNGAEQGAPEVDTNEPQPEEVPENSGPDEEPPVQDPYEDLADMLAEVAQQPLKQENEQSHQKEQQTGKQYVKQPTQASAETGPKTSGDSDGGFGNPSAILTVAIFISIMAIIMGFFTIIAS